MLEQRAEGSASKLVLLHEQEMLTQVTIALYVCANRLLLFNAKMLYNVSQNVRSVSFEDVYLDTWQTE